MTVRKVKGAGRSDAARWGFAIGSAGLVLALLFAVRIGAGSAQQPDSALSFGDAQAVGTTTPEETERRVGGTDGPEVMAMAEELSIDPAEAAALLGEQALQSGFVDSVFDHPGFVTYRGIFAPGGALLLVEPGFDLVEPFASTPEGLQVRAMTVAYQDRQSTLSSVEETAATIGGDSFAAVAYDPFENTYTVWLEEGFEPQLAKAILAGLSDQELANASATVLIEETGGFIDIGAGSS